MNLDERLTQVRKDKSLLEKEEKEILQKIEDEKKPKWKHGDMFVNKTCRKGKRVLLKVVFDEWKIIDEDVASISQHSGTYESCVNYINKRIGKNLADEYVFVRNIFE